MSTADLPAASTLEPPGPSLGATSATYPRPIVGPRAASEGPPVAPRAPLSGISFPTMPVSSAIPSSLRGLYSLLGMSAPSTLGVPLMQATLTDDTEKAYLRGRIEALTAQNAGLRTKLEAERSENNAQQAEIKALSDYIAQLEEKGQAAARALPPGFNPELAMLGEYLVTQLKGSSHQPLPEWPVCTQPAPRVSSSQHRQAPTGTRPTATAPPVPTYAATAGPGPSFSVPPVAWQKATSAKNAPPTPAQSPPENVLTISDDDQPWQTVEDRHARRLRKHGIDVNDPAQKAVLDRLGGNGREHSDDGVAVNFFMTGFKGCLEAHVLLEQVNVFPAVGSDRVFAISRIQIGPKDRIDSYVYEFFVKASRVAQIKSFLVDTFSARFMPEGFDPSLPAEHLRLVQDEVEKAREKFLTRYSSVYYRGNGAVKSCIQAIVNAKKLGEAFGPFLSIKISAARKARGRKRKERQQATEKPDEPLPAEVSRDSRPRPRVYKSRMMQIDEVSEEDEPMPEVQRAGSAPPPATNRLSQLETFTRAASEAPAPERSMNLESFTQEATKLDWAQEVLAQEKEDEEMNSDSSVAPQSSASERGEHEELNDSETDRRAHTLYDGI